MPQSATPLREVSNMARQVKETEDKMKAFFHEIVDQAQLISVRLFMTGSRAEVPCSLNCLQAYQLDHGNFDVDIMYYRIDRYAIPRDRLVPEGYNGTVYRICTNSMHPGYARLLDDRSWLELKHDKIRINIDNDDDESVAHGPAELSDRATNLRRSMPSFNSDEYDTTLENFVPFWDEVSAVHCPYWPAEAREWIIRTRPHGYPSKSVIKQVVRYGCDFVGVAHKLSPNRNGTNEWRFSFSKAELIIIRSWTVSQRIVYRTLSIFNKSLQQKLNELFEQQTVLCTYYFKTLMLWACEEQPPEFWTETSLVEVMRHLLITMCKCLDQRMCPNYFIPKNNMMDHLRQSNVAKEINALRAAHSNTDYISEMIKVCSRNEYSSTSVRYHARLPAWIFTSYKVINRIHNHRDNFSKLYSRQYSATLSAALKREFADIYHALCCHKKAKTDSARLHKFASYLQDAEQHLFRAFFASSLSTEYVTINTRFLSDFISDFFIRYKSTEKSKNTVEHNSYDQLPIYDCEMTDSLNTDKKLSKCIVYNRTEIESKDIQITAYDGMRKSEMPQFIRMQSNNKTSFTAIEIENYYRYWPGRSPTVNLSWFIAKAYLANLYYTTSYDHQATVSVCDDIILVYKKTSENGKFAEQYLSVLISTQWTAVYDEEIQAVLGFYSLSAFVRSLGERRSVQLGVCPVQFALYLKLRSDLEHDSGKNYEKLMNKYQDHPDECWMDIMRRNGTRAIHLSLFGLLSKTLGKTFALIYAGGSYQFKVQA